jgi:PAS domain S-box-containing protein
MPGDQFRQVVDMAPNAMILVAEDGTIEIVNLQAEKIFGYTRDELLGHSIDMLLPARFREIHARYRGAFFRQPSPRAVGAAVGKEFCGLRKDGIEFQLEIGIAPITTSHGVKVLAAIVDISERKESELRQQMLINELTRINEELNNFAYVSSHDLKSPLRGIDQLATWIEEDLAGTLNVQTRHYLRLMRRRINRMETLLDDLLQYAKVGRSNDDIVTVITRELVQDIFDLTAEKKPMYLHLDGVLPVLQARKVPLEMVFRNLIGNAIKHHDKEQGHLHVSAQVSGDWVDFTVADDGPGIAPEHQQRVFAIFQTLKPRDEVEGSGIGLALVKKVVEAQGGHIVLESDGHTGSTFRFSWPLRAQQGA